MASKLVAGLAVFFLVMNLWSGVLMSTGVGGMVGVDTRVGGDDAVDTVNQTAEDIDTGSPTGSTLFGMYNVLSDAFSSLSAPVTAGPTMLHRAGVPSILAFGLLQNVILAVYGYGIISLLMRYDVL